LFFSTKSIKNLTLLENKAELEIRNCRQILERNGYNSTGPQKGNYCYETTIISDSDKIKLLVYYGKKGLKKVLQGNRDSELYKRISQILFNELPFEDEPFNEPKEYIGTDESGKGDFFGPLVIAGVFVDENKKKKLNELVVRDSKLIPQGSIKYLAKKIKAISDTGAFDIVIINPLRYNELYEKFGNLNKLLAWGHAKVLENILGSKTAESAISDKFGDEKLITDALQEKGKKLELYQFHKAEKYTAVAAASILARDRFNDWFKKKEEEFKIKIPKGASGQVTEAAKEIKEKYGLEFLRQLSKTHFKTSRQI
jgi:ribonuclease HIII